LAPAATARAVSDGNASLVTTRMRADCVAGSRHRAERESVDPSQPRFGDDESGPLGERFAQRLRSVFSFDDRLRERLEQRFEQQTRIGVAVCD
jgi:hypothetical protein